MLSDNGCFGYVLYKYSVFGLCKWVEIGLNFFALRGVSAVFLPFFTSFFSSHQKKCRGFLL